MSTIPISLTEKEFNQHVRPDAYYLGGHHIAFAMINLRHLIDAK